METSGAWQEADQEVQQVCERICKGDPEVLGEAWYRRAEILRLRGRLDDAEKAYRTASENGRDPQPGLALLRVAQGRLVEGVGAIERVLTGAKQAWQRARILPAYTEIMLAAGELEKAAEAARELGAIAENMPTEVLGAAATHAGGATALATGDAEAAASLLRQASVAWNRIGAPYIAARIRVLLGRAYHQLGDIDGAALEREAARRVFEQLGAVVDLRSLERDVREPDQGDTRGLSPRELEVLLLVASGETNKKIAQHLGISERTVDRHVSGILCKIDAPSRAAATAFAYKRGLIS
jgi:DNA-binding NarL/FixJ family response regulator